MENCLALSKPCLCMLFFFVGPKIRRMLPKTIWHMGQMWFGMPLIVIHMALPALLGGPKQLSEEMMWCFTKPKILLNQEQIACRVCTRKAKHLIIFKAVSALLELIFNKWLVTWSRTSNFRAANCNMWFFFKEKNQDNVTSICIFKYRVCSYRKMMLTQHVSWKPLPISSTT